MSKFERFNLSPPIVKALSTAGYSDPTPIQTKAIPPIMDGRDLLGLAQTGTGKTAAFTLPLLDALLLSTERAQPLGTRALILAPTRELTSQIAQSVQVYGKFAPLRIATIVGGVSVYKQARKLKGGVDIMIATPGRLIDLEQQGLVDLSSTRFLVLDEADQMLDMGFIHPLRQIARMLPKKRQTLMFSATMPPAIEKLSKAFLTDPVQVSVAPTSTPAEKIEQQALYVSAPEKQALLYLTLEQAPGERVIIFTRTKRGAERMARRLEKRDYEATSIHGDKNQSQRQRALKAFKTNSVNILVATDVAARGIDISDVDHVINFDIPNVAEQYVHRIGRTARAGREGRATAFVSPTEVSDFRAIERLMDIKVAKAPLPEGLAMAAQQLAHEQQQQSKSRASQPKNRRPKQCEGANDNEAEQRNTKRRKKPARKRAKPTSDRTAARNPLGENQQSQHYGNSKDRANTAGRRQEKSRSKAKTHKGETRKGGANQRAGKGQRRRLG